MKTKFFIAAVAFGLAAVALRAEPEVDAAVARAVRDPKNAPLIVVMATEEFPKLISQIVTAAVVALPAQTLDIVAALLKDNPKQRMEILRAAILGQPRLAVEITSRALAAFPEEIAAIIKVASEVAPEDLRVALANLGKNAVFFDSSRSGDNGGGDQAKATPPRGSFPVQPLRPDAVVSPSR